MRIASVAAYNVGHTTKINNQRNNVNYLEKENLKTVSKPVAFKSSNGLGYGAFGGLIGGWVLAAATVATGGLAAAAVITLAGVGGAVAGGAVGDAITGDDPKEKE